MPPSQEATHAKSVPAAACRFTSSFQFADGPDDADYYPVKMLARSGQPITHWYWGRVVHDLSGVHHKASVPIDNLHRDDQPLLGYLDQFDVSSGDLWVEGALVPFGDDDKVREIVHKGRRKVPYEASIDFGGEGIRVEELDGSTSAEVNGYTFEGPGIIFRDWPLRGVAICPYGADANTRTELAASEEEQIQVTFTERTKPMTLKEPDKQEARSVLSRLAKLFGLDGESTSHEPEKPAQQLSTEKPEEPAKPAEQLGTEKPQEPADTEPAKPAPGANPGKRFVDAFGDAGGRWFAEGLSFEDAQARRIAQLEGANEALTTKLAAVDRGAEEPAEFASDEPDDSQAGGADEGNYGTGLSRLVAFNQDKLPK